jgi:hypothetical protein
MLENSIREMKYLVVAIPVNKMIKFSVRMFHLTRSI